MGGAMTINRIPDDWLYRADNRHTQRDDEILMQVQGVLVRRFEYDSCQLLMGTETASQMLVLDPETGLAY